MKTDLLMFSVLTAILFVPEYNEMQLWMATLCLAPGIISLVVSISTECCGLVRSMLEDIGQ